MATEDQGRMAEEKGWMDRAKDSWAAEVTTWSYSSSLLLDQILLRQGKTQHKGYMRVFGRRRQNGVCPPFSRRLFFILRGGWLVYYDTALMEDSGVALLHLKGCQVTLQDARTLNVPGMPQDAIAAGFRVEDKDGWVLEFECEGPPTGGRGAEEEARLWLSWASLCEGCAVSTEGADSATTNVYAQG
eukprot:CAMPEP_0114167848 /NCGR_PEP_ID=MMETSP0043_2-20121206/32652_1 /TAXON_ID=464988 /ORGANISM="Hemiselmis andersenii, Strain CCMP644" /LENGTH=186 /DNA_ID=CAMNT_0001265067 /DNA_START=114 /DNA_END=671 /DNA_ORIENTATION=+